jgi:tRNA nucleotidyltransferase/poly(A) polymerase
MTPEIFEVGGCVRDEILGMESKDIDFTFVLDNQEMSVADGFQTMSLFLLANGFKVFLSTPECFTIRAKFPKDHKNAGLIADFVLARKEVGRIQGTRRQALELGSLVDDLKRRDFTMNAIAKKEDGTLIDPFGGLTDIREKIIDTPLNPIDTFMDDPLRMIRAIRFCITKDFKISDRVWEAMKQPHLVQRLKETVSAERIREELSKAFLADTVRTIRLLSDVDEILPGFLDACFPEGLRLEPTFKKAKRV